VTIIALLPAAQKDPRPWTSSRSSGDRSAAWRQT